MRISQDDLLASIREGNAPAIVDVRSRGEYEAGHVPGAIHIPFYSAWSRHADIDASKDDSVVVYCEHGPRAGLAKFALWSAGYRRIRYLDGHMSGWKERDLPMKKGADP